MTVVAHRDGIIASDSKVTEDQAYTVGVINKIRVFENGDAAAFAGQIGMMDYLTAALNAEMSDNKTFGYRPVPSDVSFHMLYVTSDLKVYYADTINSEGRVFCTRLGDGPQAVGSGQTFAMQAMRAGKTAEEAVAQAIGTDGSCGKPIFSYDIRTKAWKMIE